MASLRLAALPALLLPSHDDPRWRLTTASCSWLRPLPILASLHGPLGCLGEEEKRHTDEVGEPAYSRWQKAAGETWRPVHTIPANGDVIQAKH